MGASQASRDEAVTGRDFCVKEDVGSPARGQSSSFHLTSSSHSVAAAGCCCFTLLCSAQTCPSLVRPTDRSAEEISHSSIPIPTYPTHYSLHCYHHSQLDLLPPTTPTRPRALPYLVPSLHCLLSVSSSTSSNTFPLLLVLVLALPVRPPLPPMPAPTNGRVAHSPSGPSLSPNAPTTNNLFAKTQDATESVWIAIGTSLPHIHPCSQ